MNTKGFLSNFILSQDITKPWTASLTYGIKKILEIIIHAFGFMLNYKSRNCIILAMFFCYQGILTL